MHKVFLRYRKNERIRRLRRVLLGTAGCILLLAAGFLCGRLSGPGSIAQQRTFAAVWRIMNETWYWGKDHGNLSDFLMDSALQGLAEHSEDPFTNYLSKEQADAFYGALKGEYSGFGLQYLTDWRGQVFVVRVFENSSAEREGLRPGDQLISVNGTRLTGLPAEELNAAFSSSEGEQAIFTLIRNGTEHTVSLTSETVDSSVFHRMENGIGILTLSGFTTAGSDAVREKLEDLKAQGAQRLILDLRGNGGGYTSALLKIAGCLLPPDTVVYKEEFRDGSVKERRTAADSSPFSFKKVVVLVDGGTASSSEVLTAALREHLGAVVVGSTTYGKGVTQSSISLPNGSTLKYTISKWLSPSGFSIHGEGITPDIEVPAHPIFKVSLSSIPEELSVAPDSVDDAACAAQMALDYLGYTVDRTDGYFSTASSAALRQFQQAEGLPADGLLTAQSLQALISACQLHFYLSAEDAPMQRALEAAVQ